MNPYIDQLSRELREYQSKYGTNRCESTLELLWHCYAVSNPVDDGRVKAAECALRPVFEELSFDASNALFDLISDLCTAYQRAAFFEGILIGTHLSAELRQ